jgi:hypothetical protein
MRNDEEINRRIEQNLGAEAYGLAIAERGLAFIEGAKVVLKHCKKNNENEIDEIIKNIKEDWNEIKKTPEEFQKLLSKLKIVLRENGIEDPKKALARGENIAAWKPRKPVTTTIPINSEVYQVRIDEPITTFTKEQEKQWCLIFAGEEVLQKLIADIIRKKDKSFPTREETPNWFKKLAPWEQAYHKQKLEDWAKANENKDPRQNLGDFLGVPPTTIRGYPGIRNAYVSQVRTYENNLLTGELVKIRSGHISPDKMKNRYERLAVVKENIKQMILAVAKEKIRNGESFLLFDLQTLITPPFDYTMDNDRLEAVMELRKELKGEKLKEFLQQNLNKFKITIPENLQFTLLTSNYPVNVGRVAANFVNAFSVLLSPIFVFMNFIPIASRYLPSPRRAYENYNTLNVLKKRASVGKHEIKAEFDAARTASFKIKIENFKATQPGGDEKSYAKALREEYQDNYTADWEFRWSQFEKGKAALQKIEKMSRFFQRISNGLSTFVYGYKAINHNAERAALEQIAVSGVGGTRLGSCMSGKDREGAISIHVAAMEAFYAKHKKFPPVPGMLNMNVGEEKLRLEYEKMAAQHFIANHDQIIAEANAPGARGLKEIETTLGKRVIAQIRLFVIEKYPSIKHSEKVDFADLTHAIAALNKPKSTITPPKNWSAPVGQSSNSIPQNIPTLDQKELPAERHTVIFTRPNVPQIPIVNLDPKPSESPTKPNRPDR